LPEGPPQWVALRAREHKTIIIGLYESVHVLAKNRHDRSGYDDHPLARV
jgi:hypothetical protein